MAQPMTQQDTQPPAETLAEAREAAALAFDARARKASHPEVATLERDHAKVIRAGEGDEYDAVQAAVIALTRRAGGDAIPAGGVETIATAVMRYVTPHLKHMIAFSTLCEAIEQAATPKPPAGGDAGAAERLANALRSVRDDLTNENGLNLHSIADVIWHGPAETTVDFIDATLAALALPAPVVEGWQPIETAILWDVYIVTDGEHVALAQYAESDWGGAYWSVDPEDALEWSPTHCITPPPALSEGRSHG